MTKHVGLSVCLYMIFFNVLLFSLCLWLLQSNFLRDTLMMKYIHRAVSLVNFYFSVMYHAFFFLMGVVCLCEQFVYVSTFFFHFLKRICASRNERKKSVQRGRPAYAALCGREHAQSHTFVRILPCCDVLALVIVFYCHCELNCEGGSSSSLLQALRFKFLFCVSVSLGMNTNFLCHRVHLSFSSLSSHGCALLFYYTPLVVARKNRAPSSLSRHN